VQDWKRGLEQKSKLRTYRAIKTEWKREDYLALPNGQRASIATLRSGTNSLRVETGRWRGEAVENRICMLCGSGAVEDEAHLLIFCDTYADLRLNMYTQVLRLTGWNLALMKEDPRWILEASLGCGIGEKQSRLIVYSVVARFVQGALKRRGKLLEWFRNMTKDTRQEELDSALRLVRRGGGAAVQ